MSQPHSLPGPNADFGIGSFRAHAAERIRTCFITQTGNAEGLAPSVKTARKPSATRAQFSSCAASTPFVPLSLMACGAA